MAIARITQVPAGAPMAAARPVLTAEGEFILAGYALIVLGALAGWGLWRLVEPVGFTPAPEMSAFAVLYVFAQGIERVLEPLMKLAGAVAEGLDKESAMAERNLAVVAGRPDRAAEWQTRVDRVRTNRAVLIWGVASFLAMLASGAFGILLLKGVGLKDVPAFVDILVTGLAVGSGTKPLHDLISHVQKTKEKNEDPPETRGG